MNSEEHRFIRDHAASWESTFPSAPLSQEEQALVDRIVDDAQIVAFGEMTHGAKEVFDSRERVLRFLITNRRVTVIIIEACFAATRGLEHFLASGEGNPAEALGRTGLWSCANREFLQLMKWIRKHNLSPNGRQHPVSVYGCDLQSIDEPKTMLINWVERLLEAKWIIVEDGLKVTNSLKDLPTDAQLNEALGALLCAATASSPDNAKIATIQAEHFRFMADVGQRCGSLTRQLREFQLILRPKVSPDEQFFFSRCVRSLEQAIAFHTPGGLSLRDRYMAENIMAVRDHHRGAKLAVLAHNLHVSRAPLLIRGERFVPMGCALAHEIGDNYKAIGSAFYGGTYLASAGEEECETEIATALLPAADTFEFSLNRYASGSQLSNLLLDFGMPGRNESGSWPANVKMRLGEAGPQGTIDEVFVIQSPHVQFNGLIYLTEVTPSIILPEYFQFWSGPRPTAS